MRISFRKLEREKGCEGSSILAASYLVALVWMGRTEKGRALDKINAK